MTTDSRKQSFYIPTPMIEELNREAYRQDRSLSWIIQQAWRIARSEVLSYPTAPSRIYDPGQP